MILYDCELVAANTCQRVARPQYTAQTARHRLQNLIAHSMAKRVVDLLEAIDIEAVHSKSLARPQLRQRLRECLAQGTAVRKIGEGVMARQMLDARLRLALLGDVLVGLTQPPPGIGTVETAMERPSLSFSIA